MKIAWTVITQTLVKTFKDKKVPLVFAKGSEGEITFDTKYQVRDF